MDSNSNKGEGEYDLERQALEQRDVRREFVENGYVVLENFFSDAELADIEAVMGNYLGMAEERIAEKAKASTPHLRNNNFDAYQANTFNFGKEASTNDAFIRLNAHPDMSAVTQTIMGGAFEEEMLLVQISTRGRGQAWHRDCHYPNRPDHYMVNRLIYTRDIIPESGALFVVPGSHRAEKLPPGGPQEPIEGEIMIAPKKGTLVFMHSSTFHRVLPNSTDQPRFSINYRIRPSGVPEGLGDIAHYRNGAYQFSTQQAVDPNAV